MELKKGKMITIYDVETSTFAKGNPFSQSNSLVYIGLLNEEKYLLPVEYQDNPYKDNLYIAKKVFDATELLVGFNLKFDLAWGRKYGLPYEKKVHDCQLVHFMLNRQKDRYPSLNEVAEYYGLGTKQDLVKKYWEAGIDTKDIPKEILEEYLLQDLELTKQVYLRQLDDVTAKGREFQRLVSLHNQDLLVLEEIEYNGLFFNEQLSLQKADELRNAISDLRAGLYTYHNVPEFNTESGDHLSALLYGGTISIPRQVEAGVFKTGARAGQVKMRWVEDEYILPRLVNPLPKTELKKEGYWSTGEDVLKSLKPRTKEAKQVIQIILSLAKLEKRLGTYYEGLPKLRKEKNWRENYLHGNLNQCVARTGRLSSTQPNLQNQDSETKFLFTSRFE